MNWNFSLTDNTYSAYQVQKSITHPPLFLLFHYHHNTMNSAFCKHKSIADLALITSKNQSKPNKEHNRMKNFKKKIKSYFAWKMRMLQNRKWIIKEFDGFFCILRIGIFQTSVYKFFDYIFTLFNDRLRLLYLLWKLKSNCISGVSATSEVHYVLF